MKRWAATAAMLLVLLGVSMAPAHADPTNAPNSITFPITCGGTTYTVVGVPGQGQWTPALVTNSNQVLIPTSFDITFTDLTTGLPHVQSGALRALAVTRLQRSSLFAELPTMDEAGVTGFDMDSWAGIVAPARTPPAIVTRLNTELVRILKTPEIQEKFRAQGQTAVPSTPEQLASLLQAESARYSKTVKTAGIRAE